MDDFRIYGRGLNEYEVEALFKDTSDMVDLDAGLVGHYPFSGNSNDAVEMKITWKIMVQL